MRFRIPPDEVINNRRARYLGKRIELVNMPQDPHPVEPGTKGTVTDIDAIGSMLVDWDNGQTLSLIPGVDRFNLLKGELNGTDD